MIEHFTRRLRPVDRRQAAGEGFTLIELLVVIVILGILAAVVVFAVRGVGTRGEESALSADLRTLRTAQEAYCAKNGSYGTEDQLVAGRFLSEESTMSDVELLSGGNCGRASNANSAYLLYPAEPTDDSLKIGTPSDTFNFSGTSPPGINSNFGMFPYNTNMFETLVRLTPDFQVEPWLAESWDLPGTTPSGSSSPLGPMTYRFHLRHGVMFHDDTEMKADSVIYSLNTRTAGNAGLKFTTSSAAAVPGDDYAVDVTLSAVNNRLIDQLVHPSIKPIFKAGTVPASSPTNVTATGTGPFKFLSYTQGSELVVTRHDAYWGTKAKLKQLTFKFFSDSNARVLALNAVDGVDLIYDVPKDALAAVGSTNGLKAAVAPPGANEMIWINSHRPPSPGTSNDALGDVRVRRAVASAIDRATLIRATYPSGAVLANTVIPSALLGSHASLVAGPTFDRSAAEGLLDSAGWTCAAGAGNPCAAGEVRKKAGVDLRLSLLNGYTPTSLRGDSDILVEDALEAVGIDIDRIRLGDTSADQAVYNDALTNGDKDLYMERIAQNDANPASAPTNFFDCGGTFGPTGSCPNSALPNYPKNIGPGATFESLIAEARSTLDREVAKQKTAEAIREAMDNYVAGVHLASVNWLYGMKADVQSFVLHGSIRHVRWAPVFRSP